MCKFHNILPAFTMLMPPSNAKRHKSEPPPPDLLSTLHFIPLHASFEGAAAVCLGTGRFLRAVLAPALSEIQADIVFAQARGTSFGHYMSDRLTLGGSLPGAAPTYEVDTVLPDGAVLCTRHSVAACGSLGIPEGHSAFLRLPEQLPMLRYIGLGLTEAGIVHNGPSIVHLTEFLYRCYTAGLGHKAPLSVLNTDNLPFNGDTIRTHVTCCDYVQRLDDADAFLKWMRERVCFHNSMVDRITSHRAGAPEVPRAEPLPLKALVIEDLGGILPAQLGAVPGVVIRTQPSRLGEDIQLKLRVANGLHSAMVYVMALGGM